MAHAHAALGRALVAGILGFVAALSAGCSRADLTEDGARVTASTTAPAAGCVALGHFVGEGGGTFGGAWISNDSLVEYAMNDLRDQAGRAGANYVQNDPPELGQGDGTTTTATVSGTAYRCP